MSATWSIAKGRFERFVACSCVRASSSTTQLLIGTRPGRVTRGSVAATSLVSSVTAVDVSVSVSDVMAPDLRPAVLWRYGPPGMGERGQNEDRSLDGTGRRWRAAGQAYPEGALRPSIPFPRRAGTTNRPRAKVADRAAVAGRDFRCFISGPRSLMAHAGRVGAGGPRYDPLSSAHTANGGVFGRGGRRDEGPPAATGSTGRRCRDHGRCRRHSALCGDLPDGPQWLDQLRACSRAGESGSDSPLGHRRGNPCAGG